MWQNFARRFFSNKAAAFFSPTNCSYYKLISTMLNRSDSCHSVANKTVLILDLDIKTSGTGCVKIKKIECDNCKIETEKGTSVLQSIKVPRTLPHSISVFKRDCVVEYWIFRKQNQKQPNNNQPTTTANKQLEYQFWR